MVMMMNSATTLAQLKRPKRCYKMNNDKIKLRFIQNVLLYFIQSSFIKHVFHVISSSFFFSTSCTKIQFWNDWRPNQIIPFVFWFVWNLFYKNVYARSYVRFATLIFQTNVIWFGKTFIRRNLLLFFLPLFFSIFIGYVFDDFPFCTVFGKSFHISVHL